TGVRRSRRPGQSNWANPIDTSPFSDFPMTTHLTFTFGGVKVDTAGARPQHERRSDPRPLCGRRDYRALLPRVPAGDGGPAVEHLRAHHRDNPSPRGFPERTASAAA